MAENATEKIAFCWIESRPLLRKNTTEHGKTKALKCDLRRGKTLVPSRTSAEKTMVLNRIWWAYTDKCY